MSGDLALAMGAPIHAVVACVHTATDGVGRSVPAPGQGVLGAVSEHGTHSELLNMSKRKVVLDQEMKALRSSMDSAGLSAGELESLESLARRRWSLDWWQNNPSISPFRGALSMFGLTGDDITVASCHGTSTKKNDENEPSILEQEMQALGRTHGNPLYVVTQKWLTGHPKGPASAWQMNGVIQAMAESTIPGNRNLDCVDPELRKFKNLFFTNETITGQYISAAVVNSFGFGQAGGQCLLVHPDYFLASVDEATYQKYLLDLEERRVRSFKHKQDIVGNRAPFVPIKDPNSPPHSVPFSRAILDKSIRREKTLVARIAATSSHSTKEPTGIRTESEASMRQALLSAANLSGPNIALGVGVEPVGDLETSFLERNFTLAEREDIKKQDIEIGTKSTAAGHWAVKEAVVEALGNAGAELGKAHEPLCDVELFREPNGSLRVQFNQHLQSVATMLGVKDAHVSLTYAEGTAYAAAVLV